MYKSEIVRDIGGMDESLWTGEEYDMNLKLLNSGHTLKYIDKIVFYHRVWEKQKSLIYRTKNKEKRIEEIKKIQDRYK